MCLCGKRVCMCEGCLSPPPLCVGLALTALIAKVEYRESSANSKRETNDFVLK